MDPLDIHAGFWAYPRRSGRGRGPGSAGGGASRGSRAPRKGAGLAAGGGRGQRGALPPLPGRAAQRVRRAGAPRRVRGGPERPAGGPSPPPRAGAGSRGVGARRGGDAGRLRAARPRSGGVASMCARACLSEARAAAPASPRGCRAAPDGGDAARGGGGGAGASSCPARRAPPGRAPARRPLRRQLRLQALAGRERCGDVHRGACGGSSEAGPSGF